MAKPWLSCHGCRYLTVFRSLGAPSSAQRATNRPNGADGRSGGTIMKFRAWSGWRSTRLAASFVALALQLSAGASALAQLAPAGASSQPAIMDREKEIALALSACPPSVAGRAAVYVLGRSGYVKVRESGNGFTAIVQHSLPGAQEPQCMDEGAAGTFLRHDLMVAELRAQGKSSEEVRRAVAAAMA